MAADRPSDCRCQPSTHTRPTTQCCTRPACRPGCTGSTLHTLPWLPGYPQPSPSLRGLCLTWTTLSTRCGGQGDLCIWDVASGELAHRWPLQDLPAALVPQSLWGGGPESGAFLVLRYGGAWRLPHSSRTPTRAATAGLVFINAGTGTSHTVALLARSAEAKPDAELLVFACPTKGLVLVHKWTTDSKEVLLLYTWQGALVRSMQLETRVQPPAWLHCIWAPSGKALALLEPAGVRVWVLDCGILSRLHSQQNWAAWSTPSSDIVLGGSSDRYSRVATRVLQAESVKLPANMSGRVLGAVWGSRLAVLLKRSLQGYGNAPESAADSQQLHVHAQEQRGWTLKHAFSAERQQEFAPELELSADGELCAVLVWTPSLFSSINKSSCPNLHLALVHLTSGVRHNVSLTSMQPFRLSLRETVSFGRDCTAARR